MGPANNRVSNADIARQFKVTSWYYVILWVLVIYGAFQLFFSPPPSPPPPLLLSLPSGSSKEKITFSKQDNDKIWETGKNKELLELVCPFYALKGSI